MRLNYLLEFAVARPIHQFGLRQMPGLFQCGRQLGQVNHACRQFQAEARQVGRPLIHNRVSLILVLLAFPLIYLAAAFPLAALTIEDLGYVVPLAERLPAWMPVRDRIVRLGRRPGANV